MDGKENNSVYARMFGGKRKAMTTCKKVNKPLVEKQRRARINKALSQLKAMVLDNGRDQRAVFSKLEKADILEMTLARIVQLQNTSDISCRSDGQTKYQAGFYECAVEAIRYLGDQLDDRNELKMKLVAHLAGCIIKSNPSDSTWLLGKTEPSEQTRDKNSSGRDENITEPSANHLKEVPMTNEINIAKFNAENENLDVTSTAITQKTSDEIAMYCGQASGTTNVINNLKFENRLGQPELYQYARPNHPDEAITEIPTCDDIRWTDEENGWPATYKTINYLSDFSGDRPDSHMAKSSHVNSHVEREYGCEGRLSNTSYLFEHSDSRVSSVTALVQTSAGINKQTKGDFGNDDRESDTGTDLEVKHGDHSRADEYDIFGHGISRVWRPW